MGSCYETCVFSSGRRLGLAHRDSRLPEATSGVVGLSRSIVREYFISYEWNQWTHLVLALIPPQ